jgi:hypothetical protein
MTGCQTCGGFGDRLDPIAHDLGEWDEADYRRDGDQALAALADSITRHDRQEEGE